MMMHSCQCLVVSLPTDLLEIPLVFEVPLPAECTVAGTNSRSYNQGQCSRKPCQTSKGECASSLQCCFEVATTSSVKFTCSDSKKQLKGSVVVMCKCQPCSKLHAQIKGRVLSSLDKTPIVLAAIMVGSEIATFSDQEGRFFFELTTGNREVTLLMQEARHKQLQITINIHPSLSHDITIILEYVQSIQSVDKLQHAFRVQLSDNLTMDQYGIDASLRFEEESLVHGSTSELYVGPGEVLHSLYHDGNQPDFTMPAIHHMVYKDSKGADFTIQSFLIGSLRVLDDDGQSLILRSGVPLVLSLSLKFDRTIGYVDVANLHLFVYSDLQSRWLDHGRMNTIQIEPISKELGMWVTLRGRLRELNPMWAVGFPSRVTCYTKSRAFHKQSNQELVGLSINLKQSDEKLGRATFYQHTTQTVAGIGACLKSVCQYGGMISTLPENKMVLEAVAPTVENGIIMGKNDQIMFYTTTRSQVLIDGRTPYYVSQEACMRTLEKTTAYFKFVTYSAITPPLKPSILLSSVDENTATTQQEYCFIKVTVYDCATFTDVKVLSYASENELLSLHFDIAEPPNGAPLLDSCDTTGISQLRASCVEFTCNSDVHVTVQSRPQETKSRDCRYWSSSASSIPWTVPSGHRLASFNFKDTGTRYSGGLYHASTRELALMKCYSGSNVEPENIINPYRGTAVTFTCQL